MGGSDTFDEELLVLASRRLDFLEQLREATHEKRDLVEVLGHSRSTVNRAVAELEEAGLVVETNDGYETTLTGRLSADMYRQAVTTTADICDATAVLDPLPAASPIGLDLIAGVTAERTDGPPPFGLLERLRNTLRTADEIRGVVPTLATLETLRICHSQALARDVPVELILRPALLDRLTGRFPSVYRELASSDSFTLLTGDGPRFTGFQIEADGSVTTAVVVYTDDSSIHGVLVNESTAANRWFDELYDEVRSGATDSTDELTALDDETADPSQERASNGSSLLSETDDAEAVPIRQPTAGGPPDAPDRPADDHSGPAQRTPNAQMEANGFVQLCEGYFERRDPQPPAVSLRTSLDLVEVYAGYAIDREFTHDGARRNVTKNLVENLRDGDDHVIVGPPGSGKSTVCKSVACRWYEDGYGPVFYRESGSGTVFDSPAAVRRELRECRGHVLVVVEDAVRSESNAVFRLMTEFSGDRDVTFLLDSRETEWQRPDEFPIDAGLEAYRREAIETVEMPRLDQDEGRRLVEHFQTSIDDSIELSVESLVASLEDDPTQSTDGARPGRILLLLHRLSACADPITTHGMQTPTTLTQDIQRVYDLLDEADNYLALDVGLTVNLLNASGVSVDPELVHALADEGDHDTVREALALLEGRLLFPTEADSRTDTPRYRTIHETWSRVFLKQCLELEPERDAQKRFGRCVSRLLSLAADTQLRERIDWEFTGEAPTLSEITIAPGRWADEFVSRVFTLGQEFPSIAPLFGTSAYSDIELPDACSPETRLQCVEWRGEMHRKAGRYEWATHEFDRLETLATETAAIDAEQAQRKVALSLNKRGEIEMHQGDLDAAEEMVTRACDIYDELADSQGKAASLLRLGIVEWTRGDYPSAEEKITQSLEINRDVGDLLGESKCLSNLAVVALRTGEPDDAEAYATRSLEIGRAMGAKANEAETQLLLGEISLEQDSIETAEAYVRRSFEIAGDVGDRRTEANSLLLLGEILQAKGDPDAATEYLIQSLDIWRELGIDHGKAECLRTLGTIAKSREEHDEAAEYLTRSLDAFRAVGDRRAEAETLSELGALARDRGRDREACDRFELASEAYQEVGAAEEALRSIEQLVALCESSGNRERAVKHCETAVELAQQKDIDGRNPYQNKLERLSGNSAE